MKTKLNGLLTLLLAFVVHISFAQDKTITGTVTDVNGLPLPGVNIVVEGTTTGTQTDFDGNYTINASQGQTLLFTYIGQKSVRTIIGASNTVNVQMEDDTQALEEVVVTALGISREKKSLGYATQEIEGDQVNTAKDQNFVNSLSGKIAGLDIKKSSTMGGSANVIIRGYASITGNNQALFVVDGVPLSNETFNSTSQQGGGNGYDYGNAASDINPDDIASINVLKGSAATALYGSRAANGVIIISTKKGAKRQGLGVSITSSVNVGKYDKSTFAEFQNEYGQGYGPFYGAGYIDSIDVDGDGIEDVTPPTGEDGSFGLAFDPNLLVYQWDSYYPQLGSYLKPRPWVAPEHGPEYFFQTSVTSSQNIAISQGFERGSLRMSYTRLDQTGILPNSKIGRHTLDLVGTMDLNDKITITGKATYTKNSGLGRYGTGYDAENIMTNMRQWWANSTDLKEQRDAYFATGQNITWNPSGPNSLSPKYWDNPYWTRYENYNTDERNRLFGYATISYDLTDWVEVFARATVDSYGEIREERNNVGSVDTSQYTRRNINFAEYNYDLFLNFNKDLSDKIGIAGVLGTNYRQTKTNRITAATDGGLKLEGLYALSNSVNPIVFGADSEFDADVRVVGVFGNVSLDYDDTLFLEGSIRNDTFSTLPDGDNSFYYPAISASFVFSNLFDSSFLSFGKLRAGYAEVGNGATSYQLLNTFNPIAGFGGATLYSNPGTSNNPLLKEERTESKEIGLEMNFWNRRLGFDVSLYEQVTSDAIIPVEISPATGFTNTVVNSAQVSNKGIEAQLYFTALKSDSFSWSTDINFSTYKSEVLDLFQDSQNILVNSFFGVSLNAAKGEAYGTIKGTDYVYLNGQKVVGEDGNYLKTDSNQVVLGDINPDWKAGISNTFKYKDLSLSFLIDIQEGGSVFSGDTYFGMATGIYPETAGLNDLGNPVRDPVTNDNTSGGIILPGVKEDGTPNDIRGDFTTYENPYGRYGNAPDAQFIYDASYIKLREVTLGYSLPAKIIKNLPFTGLTITAVGRNLWIIDKDLPYADPEQSFGAGNVQGFQIGAYPSVKEYGFNIKLEF
ncbi:SusC/RagA family TonB-linked outer membrane protein [Flagellimonas baculiformis]|uniref:SusC/RagA family TonB-linked outer membrane protein n=1 Tax=Flagellimonas baculiformis TaxID=3067310 RepID=UPI00296F9B39|nr:SusC/RagA family TonB-linked outer membrane protein [Muricauda sp. D6]